MMKQLKKRWPYSHTRYYRYVGHFTLHESRDCPAIRSKPDDSISEHLGKFYYKFLPYAWRACKRCQGMK